MNRISNLFVLSAIVLTFACGSPIAPSPTTNNNSIDAIIASKSYHIANSNSDPFYLVESAPCALITINDGLSSHINALFINSQNADVYAGLWDATGKLLLQASYIGNYTPGVHGGVIVSWPTNLDARMVTIVGYINGVYYPSDYCGLLNR